MKLGSLVKETLANNNNIKELERLTNGVGNRAGWARFCVRRASLLIVLVVLAVVVEGSSVGRRAQHKGL